MILICIIQQTDYLSSIQLKNPNKLKHVSFYIYKFSFNLYINSVLIDFSACDLHQTGLIVFGQTRRHQKKIKTEAVIGDEIQNVVVLFHQAAEGKY